MTQSPDADYITESIHNLTPSQRKGYLGITKYFQDSGMVLAAQVLARALEYVDDTKTETKPLPNLPGSNPHIYGLHDRGGEGLLKIDSKAAGWIIGTHKVNEGPIDYSELANEGYGVIVRLNYGYGTDEGGTIPDSTKYDVFAQACGDFVSRSKGVHKWIIGNEMNMEREQPRDELITPRRYATCFNLCRASVRSVPGHRSDEVIPGAPAPFNSQTPYLGNEAGDWVNYLRDMLKLIGVGNVDGIAIHAYSHGYHPDLIFSDAKMDVPFHDRHFNFYTYRDQMAAIPGEFRNLPVYITEMNGDVEPDNHLVTWPRETSAEWIRRAYGEINWWNNQPGNQKIRCACLYRWSSHDKWSIANKPYLFPMIQAAVGKGYRWT